MNGGASYWLPAVWIGVSVSVVSLAAFGAAQAKPWFLGLVRDALGGPPPT